MEGTRGAVKNRFSFVSPLSASVAVTESSTANCDVSTVPEHFVKRERERIGGLILVCSVCVRGRAVRNYSLCAHCVFSKGSVNIQNINIAANCLLCKDIVEF